jgi:hypothetical protein
MTAVLRVLALTALVAAGACSSHGTEASSAYLRIDNTSAVTLTEVYYTACSDSAWGANRVSGNPMAPSTSRTFAVVPGCWDIKVVTDARDQLEFRARTVAASETTIAVDRG